MTSDLKTGDSSRCPKCKEDFEPGFEVCWKCGTDSDGVQDPEFTHAEENLPNDDSWVTALGWFGFLTGTFVIREEKESVPLVKGDFVIPEWVNPILLGLGMFIVSAFLRDRSSFIWAWVAGGVSCLWGLVRYAIRDR